MSHEECIAVACCSHLEPLEVWPNGLHFSCDSRDHFGGTNQPCWEKINFEALMIGTWLCFFHSDLIVSDAERHELWWIMVYWSHLITVAWSEHGLKQVYHIPLRHTRHIRTTLQAEVCRQGGWDPRYGSYVILSNWCWLQHVLNKVI